MDNQTTIHTGEGIAALRGSEVAGALGAECLYIPADLVKAELESVASHLDKQSCDCEAWLVRATLRALSLAAKPVSAESTGGLRSVSPRARSEVDQAVERRQWVARRIREARRGYRLMHPDAQSPYSYGFHCGSVASLLSLVRDGYAKKSQPEPPLNSVINEQESR